MEQLIGIGASVGIAVGKAYILSDPIFAITNQTISDVDNEYQRYQSALIASVEQLSKIKKVALKKMGEEKAAIFDAHILLIQDPEIQNEVESTIKNKRFNTPYVVEQIYNRYHDIFTKMNDAYFKERADDIIDVKRRILSNLLHVSMPDIIGIDRPVIIVAHDLTPSQTALLDKKFIKGFITEVGGKTSHAAIMARSMEIPAILGTKNLLDNVKNGMVIGMDGSTGDVEIQPNIDVWEERNTKFLTEKKELEQYINKPTITKDGRKILIECNIGRPADLALGIKNGCEGVGLYRSEFLYMDNDHWPTEEEQFNGYKAVLEDLKNYLVVIRTLDIGGDKKLSYFQFEPEMNPFLGYRAIRFCLDHKDIFKTQLRALGRASMYGKLAIMFPMIATIDEFKAARVFAEETFAELKKEGHEVSNDIQLGMMVEVPSSAALAKHFAKYADFFSIGTNDLIQYSLACDRMSQKVSYLYQPNNPALLTLIKSTIDGGHASKRWVGMCGEMASDVLSVPILLGLGLDAFSVSASAILKTRKIINHLTFTECQTLANEALSMDTVTEVNELVKKFLKSKGL